MAQQAELKGSTDYIKEFNEQFVPILEKNSPEYWKLLYFDILKLVSDARKTDADLQGELFAFIPDDKAIKYLITFRKEICAFLKASGFF